MPLFDYVCRNCGQSSEILIMGSSDRLKCGNCGGADLEKVLSAPSSMSGMAKQRIPGPGDTGCCGSSPGEAAGCAGPGSCCGNQGR